jgi:putative transposase
LARAHQRYAGLVDARRRGAGRFRQGRYGATARDEDHLAAACRHVTFSPAPARLAVRADDWPWSSARAPLGLGEDPLTDLAPTRQRFARFADRLADKRRHRHPRHRDPTAIRVLREARKRDSYLH